MVENVISYISIPFIYFFYSKFPRVFYFSQWRNKYLCFAESTLLIHVEKEIMTDNQTIISHYQYPDPGY